MEKSWSSRYLLRKYELGKLIGIGSFAKVYQARNMTTGQTVAIKVVTKQYKINTQVLTSNIMREISILNTLQHPNIIRLYEVLATKTKIYFVLEFAKGGNLLAKLVAKGHFNENLARHYFHQLISAVAYCHSIGIFHRDLKPENLLLDGNWDLKLTDFGLSTNTDHLPHIARLKSFCGTPAYIAPEIIANKGYDGAKVDIWSCGIILFALTAGYLPFYHPNVMVTYRKIYKGQFLCPKWMSPDLKLFLSKLLDSNPDTRITVDQIINDSWFLKGNGESFEFKFHDNHHVKRKELNAFDIITSFSSGPDLSDLLGCSVKKERFVSAASHNKIIRVIEEVAMEEENVSITVENDRNVEVEGQNGKFSITAVFHRLTEALLVVEITRKQNGVWPCRNRGRSHSDEMWEHKLKPRLTSLIYGHGTRVVN